MNSTYKTFTFSGIYKLVHISDGKIYVGQACNIAKRIYRHRFTNNIQTHIARAIKNYGWDAFEVFVLERVDDLSFLNEREQYWIDTLDACNHEVGYNVCPTAQSSLGRKHSSETKIKMSIAHKGQYHTDEAKIKISVGNKGKHHTDETIKRISALNKGKHHSLETRIKISIANKGRYVSNETRIKIATTLRGRHHSEEAKTKMSVAHMDKNLSEETRTKISATKIKPTFQLDPVTGEILKRWNSQKDAGLALNISASNISGCCKNKLKTAGGFAWQRA